MIITIDGPTASGKSTAARAIARDLHIYYINSGLLFRGVAYILVHDHGYTPATVGNVTQAELEQILDPRIFVYAYDTVEHVFFDGREITSLLKNEQMDVAASVLATNGMVRLVLLDYQRYLATKHDVIVDGRDAGSCVFPHADVKIFLIASLAVRAQRLLDMHASTMSLAEAMKFIADRDERDMTRTIAPLVVPQNAIELDSSDMSEQDVVAYIKSIVAQKKGNAL
jgi:cytidylate kinase